MLILSHQTAKPGDEVVAVSSTGSFVTVPQIAGGLGPWVVRSPRVPSVWYITQSAIPSVVSQSVSSSVTNSTTIGASLYGFDVSCEVRLSTSLDRTSSGLACYGAIRLDCVSSYIEIGRYKTSVGQSIGIRSNVAGIQSLFGDTTSTATSFTIRMAKYQNRFLLQCDDRVVTIDTTGASFGAGSILFMSYADASFNSRYTTVFSSIDLSPATFVDDQFVETGVLNNRVVFTMPRVTRGTYQIAVSGFEIEDSTTIFADSNLPRALPAGRGVTGIILGDDEVR